jgi:hypothetical protein
MAIAKIYQLLFLPELSIFGELEWRDKSTALIAICIGGG